MNTFDRAVHEIRAIDDMACEDRWINRIHPLVKLLITVFYIAITVSFDKYDLSGLLGMAIYLIFIYGFGELPVRDAFRRLWFILPLICAIGLPNPLFDHQYAAQIGGFTITGGMISMLTLMLKGIFSVLAAYALVVTTGITKICYALRLLHVPGILVTQILLMYRYISLLLTEAGRIVQAYMLRAPGQNGIHHKAWGPLAGQLLLRSIERAEKIYKSMCLRGFNGEFYYGNNLRTTYMDYFYLAAWALLLILFRCFPVFEFIGGIFT